MPRKLKRRTPVPPLKGMSPLISRLFTGRGITNADAVDHRLSQLLNPGALKGIAAAAELLAASVTDHESILIIGDFDADGATSSALMVHALRALRATRVDYLVPNRFDFGYGLTPEIVDVARSRAPHLIVTVDNGIASIEGIDRARQYGIKTLVTDHHLPGAQLPNADAIVNPNQPGCNFPSKNLAGVGVAFYLLSALRQTLGSQGWFERHPAVNLADYLDLVAVGTIADLVPMDKNNRILVQAGLQRMRAGKLRPGLRALLDLSGKSLARLTSTDLAFSIGPRLNAAGRLKDISMGIECLLTDEASKALALATELDRLNGERREIEANMHQQAVALLHDLDIKHDFKHNKKSRETSMPTGLCLFEQHWHQGVVGILAARLKDRYHRPVIAFARASEGELKGSARSIQGLHIRDALDAIATRNPGLILKFGGHAMAAGLSLKPQHYQKFCQQFDIEAKRWLQEDDLQHLVITDGPLGEDFTVPLARQVGQLCPWGQGFPEPLFDDAFEILEQRIVGGKHLKLKLRPLPEKHGHEYKYAVIGAIAFGRNQLLETRVCRMAYRLDVNQYRGLETVQLIVACLELE